MQRFPNAGLQLAASVIAISIALSPHQAIGKTERNTGRSDAILASPEQDEAERMLIGLLEDQDVKAIQAGLRAQLGATPIGLTKDGKATLDRAIACWTTSLIQKEITTYRATPAFIWTSEDTPHDWRGRHVPCAGVAADNPDNIYRTAVIEGSGSYEVLGQFNAPRRASQLIIQIGPGELSIVPDLTKAGSEMVAVLAAFGDGDLKVSPDGTFRITLGPAASGANHVVTPAGPVYVSFRDSLGDWSQEPVRLSLKRIDTGGARPFDKDELRRRIVGRLGDYARGWSVFPAIGFGGGLEPNTHGDPIGREGGWGFVAGLRYSLAPDEAVAVTISRGGAGYLGFQVVDPWTIAGDARKHLTSLNLAQAMPDKDGNYTYVISPSDPGVANWLDTTGLHDGFGIIRWQATPGGATKEGLFRDFRIIKVREAEKLPGIAKITPDQRQAQLAKRAKDWDTRLR